MFRGAPEFERQMCDSQGAKGAEASAPRLCGAGNGCPLPIGAGVSEKFFWGIEGIKLVSFSAFCMVLFTIYMTKML